jgi:hypothetical protein
MMQAVLACLNSERMTILNMVLGPSDPVWCKFKNSPNGRVMNGHKRLYRAAVMVTVLPEFRDFASVYSLRTCIHYKI